MLEQIEKDLVQIGLSEKEAQIYLAALSLGFSSVQNIAKKAAVNRVTTYVMIEQLTQKGLLSSFSKGKKKMYRAERPERLLTLIHEREKAIRDQESQFKSVLPELRSIMARASVKTYVRFYEGLEGFKTIHEELRLQNFKEYCEVDMYDTSSVYEKGDSPARDEVREMVMKNEIKARIILIGGKSDEGEYEKALGREVRYLPSNIFPFSCEIGIYGSTVVFWLVREDYNAVMIEDDLVAKNMKLLFNAAWAIATKDFHE